MPPFHGDRMLSYGTKKNLSNLTPGEVFLARRLAYDMALEVIFNVVFGIYEGEIFDQLKDKINKLMDSFF